MNKIHSRFEAALKNGSSGRNGWQFVYTGKDIALLNNNIPTIKKLSAAERLYFQVRGISDQIIDHGKIQMEKNYYQDKNLYLYYPVNHV